MKKIKEIEKAIGVVFADKNLLDLAFVHKSYVNEAADRDAHNERLEYLGDAVLELAVTDYLYHKFPNNPEGDLTNWRSALVKGKNLAKVAKKLGLGEFLYLSRGEELSGGREKAYILANTVEALIGAIYLDGGFEVSRKFIMKHIVILLDEIISQGLDVDPKSRVQELAQEKLNITPRYELLSESGPDHDKKFVMGIYFGDDLVGEGTGSSKQDAEQSAAGDAMKKKLWN